MLAGCGGGGDAGAGTAALVTVGQSVETPAVGSSKGQAVFPGLPRSGHFVIIENGVIDAWEGKNINTVIYDYYALIQRVRDEGRIPVLTGFSHQALGGELNYFNLRFRDFYDTIVQAVAINTSTTFADWGRVPFYGAFDLIDFVHPNRNYSNRLIGRLAMTLDPLTTNCTDILVPPG
ncbi:hypothetical protein [Variovorax sp. J31P207]|uniref:hypothetical protein n=1 Tax=Variovorax sp. J31P207 TaxID=3053510 RepID=UPI0025761D00|nr:hypothetical protein [Variovorax sp. J31P207]MDM0072521.1 hypothetical protein [Variovorax sp. J31P207]